MAGLLLGLGILLAGCGDRQSTAEDIATPEDTQTDRIVVGFSQVGAESDWRSANTESMKSTFTKAGQPDPGHPNLYPAGGGLHRAGTGDGDRMGHGAQGSKGCRDPGGHRGP